MSEMKPFQYSILKYMHDVVTGEFLNVGLAVYSKNQAYFRAKLLPRYKRITNTFPGADGEFYRRYINFLQLKVDHLSNQISKKQINMFEEWPDGLDRILELILPPDDSSVRFGEIKVGLAEDLDDIFDDLYSRFVEQYLEEPEKVTRTDDDVWIVYSGPLRERNILSSLQSKIIRTHNDEIEFDHAWKNGRWNLLQPLSFDLMTPTYIRRKARTWLGTNLVLDKSNELSKVYYLLGKPKRHDLKLQKAYGNAKDILTTDLVQYSITLIEEDEADDFAKELEPQIESALD